MSITKKTRNRLILIWVLLLPSCSFMPHDTYKCWNGNTPYTPLKLVDKSGDTLSVMLPIDYAIYEWGLGFGNKNLTTKNFFDTYQQVVKNDTVWHMDSLNLVNDGYKIIYDRSVDSIYNNSGEAGLLTRYFFTNGLDSSDNTIYLKRVVDGDGNNVIFSGPAITQAGDSVLPEGVINFLIKILWDNRVYCAYGDSPFEECIDFCPENIYIVNPSKSLSQIVPRVRNVVYRYYK